MSDLKFVVNPLPDGAWRAEAILDESVIASCRDINADFALRIVEERAKSTVDLQNEFDKLVMSNDTIRNAQYWAEVLRRNPGKLCHAEPLLCNKIYAWLCRVPWEWLALAAIIIGLTAWIHWEW